MSADDHRSSATDGRSTATPDREDRRDRLGREAFVTLFVTGNRFTEQIEHLCRVEGVSHPQYTVLWVLCLADAPDGLPMGALADGLLTRASDTTRLVDRMLAAGLVAREPSPGDRRVVLVSPTDEGRTVFERLTAAIKELHRRQWGALTVDELRTVTRLLTKARAVGRIRLALSRAPPPFHPTDNEEPPCTPNHRCPTGSTSTTTPFLPSTGRSWADEASARRAGVHCPTGTPACPSG